MQKYYHKFLGNCFFLKCYNFNLKCISKNIISITIVLFKVIVGIIHVKTKILDKKKYKYFSLFFFTINDTFKLSLSQ